MLSSIIGPISSLAGTWLQGRVDKAKAETEVKVRARPRSVGQKPQSLRTQRNKGD